MSVTAVAHHYHALPDTPYALWTRDELTDYLRLPKDGSRAEVIGGEIVVSPGPTLGHNAAVTDVQESFFRARLTNPEFPWRCVQNTDLNLAEIEDGYIPDLVVVDSKILKDGVRSGARYLLPDQVGLVVEVTSQSDADNDRRPAPRRSPRSKWTGYARVEVPYYLLIDRDPRVAQSLFYSNPEPASGMYRHLRTWEFGETVRLPEPFGVEIDTGDWEPWDG